MLFHDKSNTWFKIQRHKNIREVKALKATQAFGNQKDCF